MPEKLLEVSKFSEPGKFDKEDLFVCLTNALQRGSQERQDISLPVCLHWI
jgi:hypothetical protein